MVAENHPDKVPVTKIAKDPNFPEHLNISASSFLQALPKSVVSRQKVLTTSSDIFGPQAQHDAIRQYGIAGRVW